MGWWGAEQILHLLSWAVAAKGSKGGPKDPCVLSPLRLGSNPPLSPMPFTKADALKMLWGQEALRSTLKRSARSRMGGGDACSTSFCLCLPAHPSALHRSAPAKVAGMQQMPLLSSPTLSLPSPGNCQFCSAWVAELCLPLQEAVPVLDPGSRGNPLLGGRGQAGPCCSNLGCPSIQYIPG